MSQQQEVILHLSLISGVGPVAIQKLLDFCLDGNRLSVDLYQLTCNDIRSIGFSSKLARLIVDGLSDRDILHKELDLLCKHNIKISTILSEDYPPLLKNIYMPPPVLYFRGLSLNAYDKSLAIVGARAGNNYSRLMIENLVPILGEHQWSIVSGGALGVDTMAHQSALKHQVPTVSVLGSGLLCPYPRENKQLFDKIANEGTLVSSFPLGFGPTRGNFPARNRIIAGLSRGVLVVQAGKRSGANITARYGLDQGKEIFAVPGACDDPLSAGCHKLIQDGAKLVSSPIDILNEFGETCEEETTKKAICRHNLDPVKARIVSLCNRAASMDDIVDQLELSIDQACEHIFDLQLKGLIEQNFMGLFQITS